MEKKKLFTHGKLFNPSVRDKGSVVQHPGLVYKHQTLTGESLLWNFCLKGGQQSSHVYP